MRISHVPLLLSLIEELLLLIVEGIPVPLSTDQEIVEISPWETSEPMMKSLAVKPINPTKVENNSAVEIAEAVKQTPISPYIAHKRKIKGKKSFMQYLMEKSAVYQATSTTAQPVIYNAETNSTYTLESIAQMCKEADEVANNFGITDVSSFAISNCRLVRIYYPGYTCQQITDFLEYCKNKKST